MSDVLRAATPSPRFRKGFAWWTAGMIRRSFHAWRLTPEAHRLLTELGESARPVLAVSNHPSWWDPLIALQLAEAYLPGRPLASPIELAEYERFGVLRKLGLFGLDPRHPEALPQMLDHLDRRLDEDENLVIMVTAQGRFADPRSRIRLRPGAAAVAAHHPELSVLTLAIEYPFWDDRRAEIAIHAAPVDPPTTPTRTAWHRALNRTLQSTADGLADRVIARDPAAFVDLPGKRAGRGSAVNPLYDFWLRLRGVNPRLNPRNDPRNDARNDTHPPSEATR